MGKFGFPLTVDGQGARLAGNSLAYVFDLSLLEPIGVLLVGLRSGPGALWLKEGHLRRGMVAGTIVMAGVLLLRNWQSG